MANAKKKLITHVGRIHGWPSVGRSNHDQNYSCRGQQPSLQQVTTRALEEDEENDKGNHKSQHPFSDSPSVQIHFQRRPPNHVPVLRRNHFHNCHCTTRSTSCLFTTQPSIKYSLHNSYQNKTLKHFLRHFRCCFSVKIKV